MLRSLFAAAFVAALAVAPLAPAFATPGPGDGGSSPAPLPLAGIPALIALAGGAGVITLRRKGR